MPEHDPNDLELNSLHLATRLVHAGERADRPEKRADDSAVATVGAIAPATGFSFDRTEQLEEVFADQRSDYNYSRYGSPTTDALERLICSLEGPDLNLRAFSAGSGMAAIHLALCAALQGEAQRLLASTVLYGQTSTLLRTGFAERGVEVERVDVLDLDAVRRAIERFRPSVLLFETLSNPLLRLAPIDELCEICREHDVTTIVDNTFLTPALLRPLERGADLVVHSLTKFLAGHGDVLGGVVTGRVDWTRQLLPQLKTLGPNLGPFEAFLAMRGIKTLDLRMQRHCANAIAIAEGLRALPGIRAVFHPSAGSATPDRQLADRLLPDDLHGGMVAFELEGPRETARERVFQFLDRLRLVVSATTLGDVHSVILYPAMSSHRDLDPQQRRQLGISDDLLRLSVGIEHPDDVLADLSGALGR